MKISKMSCFTNRATVTIFQSFAIILLQERVEGFFFFKEKAFYIVNALQPNILPISKHSILSTRLFLFCQIKAMQKTSGQNILAGVNISRSRSLFLLDLCVWKQWVVGHFISRKRVRLLMHIVSMAAIYFARVVQPRVALWNEG